MILHLEKVRSYFLPLSLLGLLLLIIECCLMAWNVSLRHQSSCKFTLKHVVTKAKHILQWVRVNSSPWAVVSCVCTPQLDKIVFISSTFARERSTLKRNNLLRCKWFLKRYQSAVPLLAIARRVKRRESAISRVLSQLLHWNRCSIP